MISEVLRHGEQNALSKAEIRRMIGRPLTDREIGQQVRREREQGNLILSTVRGRGGYFLPSCDPQTAYKELTNCLETIESRARNSFSPLKCLKTERKRLAAVLSGQLSFNDGSGVHDVDV